MICATNIVVTCYRTIRNTKRCHLVSSKTVCRGMRSHVDLSHVDLSHDRKLCRRSLLPAVSSQHTRHWHWQSSPVFRGLCALCTRLLHVCECGAYPRALCENSTYHRGLRERRRTASPGVRWGLQVRSRWEGPWDILRRGLLSPLTW